MSFRVKLAAMVLAPVIAAAALLAGCGRGGDHDVLKGAAAGAGEAVGAGFAAAEGAPVLRLGTGTVAAVPVRGRIPRSRLWAAVRGARRTIEDLYARAFLAPARGEGVRRVERLFVPEARRGARRDRAALTLGSGAARLGPLHAPRGRMSARVLADAHRRPTTVVAEVRFAASAGGRPVRHGGTYVLRRLGRQWRIVSYRVSGRVPRPVRRPMEDRTRRPGLLFLLAIGSDARAGQRIDRMRADSLHVIGVNFRKRSAAIVGIPRDSFVPIPGVGTRKINDALSAGGPGLMVRTVERLTGIRIDGYLLTGFTDFRSAVSRVGGVETRIPYRMSDRNSGAYFRAGRRRLDGRNALAFTRNRYDAPGGDFGRSLNQGRLLMAAHREFRSQLRRDPTSLLRWAAIGARHVQTDMPLLETVSLLLASSAIDPGRVRNTVVSGSGAMVGGQSVVRLGSAARATFRDLRRDGTLGR